VLFRESDGDDGVVIARCPDTCLPPGT
jgi:hypothetical protein